MNQTDGSINKDHCVGQAVIVWPRGIRHEPVIYPLGVSDEETEAIRCLLSRILKREPRT